MRFWFRALGTVEQSKEDILMQIQSAICDSHQNTCRISELLFWKNYRLSSPNMAHVLELLLEVMNMREHRFLLQLSLQFKTCCVLLVLQVVDVVNEKIWWNL